mmetsp:Transcript_18172/g.44614  ORF Transcript_18172/g.44614 Transcript_18172/m.44614 type:complete len:88 (-) Transcript_18172:31-294(-)
MRRRLWLCLLLLGAPAPASAAGRGTDVTVVVASPDPGTMDSTTASLNPSPLSPFGFTILSDPVSQTSIIGTAFAPVQTFATHKPSSS